MGNLFMASTFPRRGSNFSRNYKMQPIGFEPSYSTLVSPPCLSQIFSKCMVDKLHVGLGTTECLGVIIEKKKRAQTMARLINSGICPSQLESSLSTITSISHTTIRQTLRLIKNPSKALHFFNWVLSSGFVHTPHSYFIMLEILGRARHLNVARNFLLSIPKKSKSVIPLTDKFFNILIRSYGDAGLFQESLKVFKLMKSMGISPSTVTFNSLFLILLKRGRMGLVSNLYSEMLSTYGAKPDIYTFNILIRGFCMNSSIEEAFRIFKEIERFDCTPDLITYNTIVDGLCRAGKVTAARNVVKGMYKKSEDMRPNVVSYTSLIRGYCGKGELEEAMDVFREMAGGGIKPNQTTFNTIIQGLCESQNLHKMKEILGKCQVGDVGFVPDTCTFNIVMTAHCRGRNIDEAVKIFAKMAELKVKRDSTTYSVLIRALCQEGNFEKAEQLLDELYEKEILLRDDGCVPIVAAYNPIFCNLCAEGKTEKVESIFRQLMKRGIQDPSAYKTLILGHCKEENFLYGRKLLVLMLRRNFVPDVEIYESLIKGLLRKGEPILACDTLEKMLKSSHLPRTSMFHWVLMELVKNGSALESANLLQIMLDKEIRPTINLFTDAIKVIFRNNLQDKGYQLVKNLYENGYVIKMEELIMFLCQDRKFLDAYRLLVLSLKNDQSANTTICNTLVVKLCELHRVSEAFDLYYDLLEKGVVLSSTCLEDLKIALLTEGKIREAEFVTKRT